MPNKSDRLLIIIPCFNEAGSIENVVNTINFECRKNKLNYEILVINDESKDNTLEIVKKLDCKYLDLPVNLGIGGAVQSGFKYAYRNNFDYALQVDGDGQHPANEIHKLMDTALEGKFDLIIGSRFLGLGGFQSTFLRRFGIVFFKFLNKFLINQTISDSTSGFRLMNRKTLEHLIKYYPDEYPEPETLTLLGLKGIVFKEVPVLMEERKAGVSSIGAFDSIYYMVKVSLAIVFTYFKNRK